MAVTQRFITEVHLFVDEPNQRIKLMRGGAPITKVALAALELAMAKGLGKIWGFVTEEESRALSRLGFTREGKLDGYFADGPGIGVAKFLSPARAKSRCAGEEDDILRGALAQVKTRSVMLPDNYLVRQATNDDCRRISDVLTAVFTSYPTPIDSAAAINQTMERGATYMLAECQQQIVSVMSADIDSEHLVAEMTDCATVPEHRGRGLMQVLLTQMEDAMRRRGLRSLFTLARATSAGMNIAFARLGYDYQGRFINNCHIAGDWEDMNLWVKPLVVHAGILEG